MLRMGRLTVAGRIKWIGILLLVLLDLLQLHLPHFLIESSAYLGYATIQGWSCSPRCLARWLR